MRKNYNKLIMSPTANTNTLEACKQLERLRVQKQKRVSLPRVFEDKLDRLPARHVLWFVPGTIHWLEQTLASKMTHSCGGKSWFPMPLHVTQISLPFCGCLTQLLVEDRRLYLFGECIYFEIVGVKGMPFILIPGVGRNAFSCNILAASGHL